MRRNGDLDLSLANHFNTTSSDNLQITDHICLLYGIYYLRVHGLSWRLRNFHESNLQKFVVYTYP